MNTHDVECSLSTTSDNPQNIITHNDLGTGLISTSYSINNRSVHDINQVVAKVASANDLSSSSSKGYKEIFCGEGLRTEHLRTESLRTNLLIGNKTVITSPNQITPNRSLSKSKLTPGKIRSGYQHCPS